MNAVAERLLKGDRPTQIAQELKMKRYEVIEYIDEWKALARSSSQIKERAKDAVSGADQHYSMVIQRGWETVEQADAAFEPKVKIAALTLIANTEQKRIDMLQKAGLLDDHELAEQLAETESNQKILVEILRDVAQHHPDAKNMILGRLAQITHKAEGVTIPGTIVKSEIYGIEQ